MVGVTGSASGWERNEKAYNPAARRRTNPIMIK
jgi:hypothetical protein